MTVSQMQQNFPHIQWMDYINKILNGAEKVTQNDVILVGVPKYLHGLQELLRTTPKRYACALLTRNRFHSYLVFAGSKLTTFSGG